VIETLRTESFLANIPSTGCFSLTCMVGAMNSGIRVRESIRSFALAIDARGRSAEGRSMDRDLGMPKKSQRKHIDTCRGGACAMAVHEAAGLGLKQTPGTPASLTTRYAASSKAHDNDGTFNKEFYR
jgi:hypothetical protein